MCDAAVQAFDSGPGFYTDVMAQYDWEFDQRYEQLRNTAKDRIVECEDDGGVHGDGSSSTELWASDDIPLEPWSADSLDEVPWGSNLTNRTYAVYSGNYLNWLEGPTSTSTRLIVMKEVLTGQTEGAYELGLGEVRLPRGVTGSVTFKPCPTCPIDSFRVTPATTYSVNGTPLEFKDFLEAVKAIRKLDGGNQNTAVYLFFDIESRRVNRLQVDHFNG